MGCIADVIERESPTRCAMVTIDQDGGRREWTFGEIAHAARALAADLSAIGVGRGDVVLTFLANRAEWPIATLAILRLGAVALPCVRQLRAKDLAVRIASVAPAAAITDPDGASVLAEAGAQIPVLTPSAPSLLREAPEHVTAVSLAPTDPVLIMFTSGTSGDPKPAVHGARYLAGQRLQAEHWMGVGRDDIVWCTAAAGWSKAARNAFLAPWLMGARVVLHDGRFDPADRLDLLRRERVTALCMSPTEYRVVARRTSLVPLPALRSAVAAGEQLDIAAIAAWRDVGVRVRDGYGQTETGAVSGVTIKCPDRDGSMGRPLPGVEVRIVAGQLEVQSSSLPTFFLGYRDQPRPSSWWPTGDRVDRDEEGFLWFRGRADDVIISSGYRIDPLEVERILRMHPAVADAAVVGHPDDERGAIVRAVIVLGAGAMPSAGLARDLKEHVKDNTAPYKYPRRLEFADALPRTPNGKLSRAALRNT